MTITIKNNNDKWELGGPPTVGLCQLHRRAELQALQAKTWYFLEVNEWQCWLSYCWASSSLLSLSWLSWLVIMIIYHHDQCARVPPVCWRRGKQRHMHWWWRWTPLLRKKGADSVPFDIFVSIAWINQSFSYLCSRCQMRTALTPTPWPRTRMTSTPTSLTSEEWVYLGLLRDVWAPKRNDFLNFFKSGWGG